MLQQVPFPLCKDKAGAVQLRSSETPPWKLVGLFAQDKCIPCCCSDYIPAVYASVPVIMYSATHL